MAKLVTKGSKGAVGTLIKGASLVPDVIDSSLLKQDIPEDIEGLAAQIKAADRLTLDQMTRAVFAAARAGQLLVAAKEKLPKGKSYVEWLAETFTFSRRSAYNYVEVWEKYLKNPDAVLGCSSIQNVLDLEDKEDTSKKKKREPKRESFVVWAAKIERDFAERKAAKPMSEWDPEQRDTFAKMLAGVVGIYNELLDM